MSGTKIKIEAPINVDWQTLIMRLKAEAVTYKGIAEMTGVSKPSIEGYMSHRGRNPSYDIGARLVNAYLNYYPEVPKTIRRNHLTERLVVDS